MNLLRKVSFALSSKDPSMHFQVGQIWNDYKIDSIVLEDSRVVIYLLKDGDIHPWKSIPKSKAIWEFSLKFD